MKQIYSFKSGVIFIYPYTTTLRFNINIVQHRNFIQKYFILEIIFGKIGIISCFIVLLHIDINFLLIFY